MEKKAEPIKVIATNRKATHDFTIHERIEAGLQLVGSEVKSLRNARVVISDGFVEFRKGQAFLHKVQINEYSQANRWGHDIERVRKLLLHKHEIDKLTTKVTVKGYTISRPPRDGRMAFVRSPDLISVELLQAGAALEPAEPWKSMPNVGEW